VCPFNVKFAEALKVPEFAPRDFLAEKDTRTLARELLAMSPDEFSGAFKGSPMKRAKRRGLRRNASVVLGNVGSTDDLAALASALSDDEPLVRSHAAWALGRIGSSEAVASLRAGVSDESDAVVLVELRNSLAAVDG